MAPRITCQTILLPATRSGPVEEGFLIFADDQLMAVVTRLEKSVTREFRGLWYVETSYGPCLEPPGTDRTFRTPKEAQAWVLERVTHAQENQGPQFA